MPCCAMCIQAVVMGERGLKQGHGLGCAWEKKRVVCECVCAEGRGAGWGVGLVPCRSFSSKAPQCFQKEEERPISKLAFRLAAWSLQLCIEAYQRALGCNSR